MILALAVLSFRHWSPLTYAGQWTRAQCEVRARVVEAQLIVAQSAKLLRTWDFSCADFPEKARCRCTWIG